MQKEANLQSLRISSRAFKRMSLAALVAITLLIATGTWVRLSESGLGCTTWPACTSHDLIAPGTYHSLVEFTNRSTIIAIGILIAMVVVSSFLRETKRRDLQLLSIGLLVGYIGEAVLGGITVLLKLAPPLVAAHLILGLILVANATVLHWQASIPDGLATSNRSTIFSTPMIALSSLMLAMFWIMSVLGTIVTGTGPHSGKPGTPRFHLSLGGMVQIHGDVGLVFYGIAIAFFIALLGQKAPKDTIRRTHIVVILLTLQGILGYSIWFTKFSVIPAEMHTFGAALLLIALIRMKMGMHTYEDTQLDEQDIHDGHLECQPIGSAQPDISLTSAEYASSSSSAVTRS